MNIWPLRDLCQSFLRNGFHNAKETQDSNGTAKGMDYVGKFRQMVVDEAP
jgi:hypothetical protein